MNYFHYAYLNIFQVRKVIMHKLRLSVGTKNRIGFGEQAHHFYISDIILSETVPYIPSNCPV